MSGKYDDIINMPHHVSKTRPRMSINDRAAQFSPFAALTGFDATIAESDRIVEKFTELSAEQRDTLDKKLLFLIENSHLHPVVTLTYFINDSKKSGGAYLSFHGTVKKIYECEKKIIFNDGTQIGFDSIVDVQGEMLDGFFDE